METDDSVFVVWRSVADDPAGTDGEPKVSPGSAFYLVTVERTEQTRYQHNIDVEYPTDRSKRINVHPEMNNDYAKREYRRRVSAAYFFSAPGTRDVFGALADLFRYLFLHAERLRLIFQEKPPPKGRHIISG